MRDATMTKRFLLILAIFVWPAFMPGYSQAEVQAEELVLYYSNDVRGETEPCG